MRACVSQPSPQFGRVDHHITITGEEKAVHLLALEMNEMIKVSMSRMETRIKGEMNSMDSKLKEEHVKELKIAILEDELKRLRDEEEDDEGEVWKSPNDPEGSPNDPEGW